MKDVVLLDWQLCSFRSPVVDVFHIIFSSTDKPFRDAEYRSLLEHYYEKLSDTIIKLGSDPQKLFTHENFQQQLKQFSKFIFALGPLLTQFMVVDPENIANLDEATKSIANSEEGADFITGFSEKTQEEYDQRINGLFTDLVELGYYWK